MKQEQPQGKYLYRKIASGWGKMAQLLVCLSCKQKDQISMLRTHILEKEDVVAHACNSSVGETEKGRCLRLTASLSS